MPRFSLRSRHTIAPPTSDMRRLAHRTGTAWALLALLLGCLCFKGAVCAAGSLGLGRYLFESLSSAGDAALFMYAADASERPQLGAYVLLEQAPQVLLEVIMHEQEHGKAVQLGAPTAAGDSAPSRGHGLCDAAPPLCKDGEVDFEEQAMSMRQPRWRQRQARSTDSRLRRRPRTRTRPMTRPMARRCRIAACPRCTRPRLQRAIR